MLKPLQVLQGAIGKSVNVELRASVAFRGTLDGFDPHMNLVLKQATEYLEGKEVKAHPTAILRGDGVIYISRIEGD
jgi:small nuclear ribonucleoprotein